MMDGVLACGGGSSKVVAPVRYENAREKERERERKYTRRIFCDGNDPYLY